MAAPRKDNVRKLIIESARNMLGTMAFSEISLSMIAKDAGISKGTLYYHFRNREDILFAVMDDYLDRQKEELEAWINDSSKDTSLPRLMKYVLERDTSTSDMRFHLFIEAAKGNERIREKLLERYRAFAALISGIIAERTDKIPAEYLSWLTLILSDGLLIHKLIGNEELDTEKFIRATEDYVRNILALT